MKKIFLFCLLFVLLPTLTRAQAYDFSKTVGGNTLYYYIISERDRTVEVAYPGPSEDKPWKGFSKPSKQLAIPAVVLYDSVTYNVVSIGYNAFMGCDRITKLVLPPTLKEIGESAFAGCTRIEEIVTQSADAPRLDESSFNGVDTDTPVRVLTGALRKFEQAVGWRQFTQIIEY